MIGVSLRTTNCSAVLMDPGGRVVARASDGFPLKRPHPGWAEQDPKLVLAAVTNVLRQLAARDTPPAGLAFSCTMHSLFPVADDAGTPVADAMTWQDARATSMYRALRADTDTNALYRRTGCPVHSTYHPQRLRWWYRVDPERAERAHLWVSLKDWILHELTGVWATDLSLASTTGLLNLHSLTWDNEALRLSGISSAQLPPLVSPTAVVGGLTAAMAEATGLPAGLPVIAGASDGALASLGTGVAAPGQTIITVGTSGAVRKIVSEPWFDPGERTFCYLLTDRPEPLWFIGGAINNGGLTLQWVREKLYPDVQDEQAAHEKIMRDAASIDPGAEGVFMLPYFAGERSPHWAPKDKGMLYGLGMQHNRAHFARAALEGVANCLADVWDSLYGSARSTDTVRLTGDITRWPLWVQILTDTLGIPMMALDVGDTQSTGAALLGLNVLGHIGADSLGATVEPGPVYTPDPRSRQFYRQHHREHRALRRGMALMGENLEHLKDSYL